jgi:hypothetical protein
MEPWLSSRASRVVCLLVGVLAVGSVAAEPLAYAINSDSFSETLHDHVLEVDLATGQFRDTGAIHLGAAVTPFQDAEGLALDPDGQLWAVDDATKTYFRIDAGTRNAGIPGNQLGNLGLPTGITAGLDLGLTFTCSGTVLMSGEINKTLYRIDPSTGRATPVGGVGALGYKITDLAVYGDSVLGLGSEGDEGLYYIDVVTGHARPIGDFSPSLHFSDGGLGFDTEGQLWAIVEDGGSVPSKILRIDHLTGHETLVATTTPGIESLAVTAPQCPTVGGFLPIEVPASEPVGLWLLIVSMLGFGMALIKREEF